MRDMRPEEQKASLMKDMEAEIDGLLKAREGGKRLTLTEIEDVVLEARQRLGQKMAESMIQAQESQDKTEAPMNATGQKRLERKGKKTQQSKRG